MSEPEIDCADAGRHSGAGGPAIKVRLFAAAADVVGEDALKVNGAATAGELVDRICEGREERVRLVLDQCSFLIDGNRVTSPDTPIESDATVDILPPFAGG